MNFKEERSLIWLFKDKSKYTIINIFYEIFYDIKIILNELFNPNDPIFIQDNDNLIEYNEEIILN